MLVKTHLHQPSQWLVSCLIPRDQTSGSGTQRASFMITGFCSLIADRADWMAAGGPSACAWRAPCTCNIQNRVVIHDSTASSRQAKMQSRCKTVPPCNSRICRVAVGQGRVRSTAANRTESNCKCDLTPFTVR